MKRYNVIVNGVSYDVAIEEVNGEASAPVAAPVVSAPVAPKAQAPKATVSGGTAVKAPMPGNILKLNVKVGDTVKKGDVLAVLEAMKMENDICAPIDGKIAGVAVQKGASVATDDVIVTIA